MVLVVKLQKDIDNMKYINTDKI